MWVDSLYVHIPFCARRCAYCDFPTAVPDDAEVMDRYIDTLIGSIGSISKLWFMSRLSTVYIGGGTPSFIGPDRLARLLEAIGRIETEVGLREFTMEVNPESVTDDVLTVAKEHGVDRISMGVQSLDPEVLSFLGRIHDAQDVVRAIERVRRHDMELSVDLMCGIPVQTEASWRGTLQGIVSLDPDHISVYPLTIEADTPLALLENEGSIMLDEDGGAEAMATAQHVLSEAGYHRYEVANYAKPDREALHNTRYWRGSSYLGIGAGAASMMSTSLFRMVAPSLGIVSTPSLADIDRVRFSLTRDTDTYMKAASSELFEDDAIWFDLLREDEALLEDLMLSMRMTMGISRARFAYIRQRLKEHEIDAQALLDGLIADGLVRNEEFDGISRYIPTESGWLLGNELFGRIWDARRG